MSFLSKEQILAAHDFKYVIVSVPEWGGNVRLRSLDADTALKQEQLHSRRSITDTGNPLSSMLANSIVDESGHLIFNEKEVHALGKKSPQAIMRLVTAAAELNKIDRAEILGNSVASRANDDA